MAAATKTSPPPQDTPPAAVREPPPADDTALGAEDPIDIGFGADEPEMAAVYDATAKHPDKPRSHTIAGVERLFYANKPTMIPLAEALKVVHIDSFKIVGKNGETYQPAKQVARGEEALKLRNDQVIATLSELSTVALTKRAMRWDEHPDFPREMRRPALERFIMDRMAQPPEPTKPKRTGERFVHIDENGQVHQRMVTADDDGDDIDSDAPLRGDGMAMPVNPTLVQEALDRRRASTAELSGYAARGGH